MTLRRPEDFTHHHAQLADIRLHYVREKPAYVNERLKAAFSK